jgi:hypothetical protein
MASDWHVSSWRLECDADSPADFNDPQEYFEDLLDLGDAADFGMGCRDEPDTYGAFRDLTDDFLGRAGLLGGGSGTGGSGCIDL